MSAVSCQGLGVSANGQALLRDVSLAFTPGALTGLIGPNGAGKSTLLRALAGYRRPDHGLVTWNGRDLALWSAAERGAASGYLPQHLELAWNYSVQEIVALGAARAPARAGPPPELMAEHGLEALAQRRWTQLSGGERARTMLAAIVATKPSIILADEPGASLDIRHRLALIKRLRALARDAIVIVVMHDLDLAARFCDRIVLLGEGRVVADGAAPEIIRGPAFEQAFGVRFQRETLKRDHDWLLGLHGPGDGS
jgi:iron complex transport system ATP-binding protein